MDYATDKHNGAPAYQDDMNKAALAVVPGIPVAGVSGGATVGPLEATFEFSCWSNFCQPTFDLWDRGPLAGGDGFDGHIQLVFPNPKKQHVEVRVVSKDAATGKKSKRVIGGAYHRRDPGVVGVCCNFGRDFIFYDSSQMELGKLHVDGCCCLELTLTFGQTEFAVEFPACGGGEARIIHKQSGQLAMRVGRPSCEPCSCVMLRGSAINPDFFSKEHAVLIMACFLIIARNNNNSG